MRRKGKECFGRSLFGGNLSSGGFPLYFTAENTKIIINIFANH